VVANMVAETLSRPPPDTSMAAFQPGHVKVPTGSRPASAAVGPLMIVAALSTSVDYSWLAKEQQDCAVTQAAASSSSLAVCSCEVGGVPLLCDSQAARSDLWCLGLAFRWFFEPFTQSHTAVGGLPGEWSRVISSGRAWRLMSPPGAKTARTVPAGRQQSTSPLRCYLPRYRAVLFLTYKSWAIMGN
jgi:hypothetical protein